MHVHNSVQAANRDVSLSTCLNCFSDTFFSPLYSRLLLLFLLLLLLLLPFYSVLFLSLSFFRFGGSIGVGGGGASVLDVNSPMGCGGIVKNELSEVSCLIRHE